MGRTDAVAFTNEWATRARQLGAIVDVEPGWDTRGNGSAANYEGGLVHHTASPSSSARPYPTRTVLINGRAGLPGPLCNVAGPWCPPEAPRLIVVSARPANHAGASGGRSMGPLPVTTGFNRYVFGLEIDYAGTVPMAPGQYRAALIFARAVADVLGRSLEYVRAHAETSVTGKWDPGYAPNKTIDMAAFRRDAANLGEDDMPLTQADIDNVRAAARQALEAPIIDWGGGRKVSVAQQTADNAKALAVLAEQVAALAQAVKNIPVGGVGSVDVQAVADQLAIVAKP